MIYFRILKKTVIKFSGKKYVKKAIPEKGIEGSPSLLNKTDNILEVFLEVEKF